jgi:5-methylcytosine-specific restriction endonuclease McrA/ribosomal protein S28E/S33
MELSSIQSAIASLAGEVHAVDVELLSGADASRVVDSAVVPLRRYHALMIAAAARAIDANQHNVDEASSAAEWLGNRLGTSSRSARSLLSIYKAVLLLPRVEIAVRNGWISMEMASVITSGAGGDSDIALELLELASTSSVEVVQRRVQEMQADNSDPEVQRKKQYASINQRGSNIYANINVLAQDATWFPEWTQREREALQANSLLDDPLPANVVRAEAFNAFMNERGSSSTTVVYHVNVPVLSADEPTCELVGVGPVPICVITELADHPILHAVLTAKNKLVGYYENLKPDPDKPLPDPIRRAILAYRYDTCCVEGCFEVAVDVDHILARANGGDHDLKNLQALCRAHHDAKTKVDVPWTIAGIYGMENRKRRQKRKEVKVEDLPDTG